MKFDVTIARDYTSTTVITVEAESLDEAEQLVTDMADWEIDLRAPASWSEGGDHDGTYVLEAQVSEEA